jgi:hypothetical protein
MKGSTIQLTSPPRGVFDEGTIIDTSSPGTIMEVVPDSAISGGDVPTGGRFSWRHSSATVGNPRQITVLLDDPLQGFLPTKAYVANTRCFLYTPVMGEDINILTAPEPGTGSVSSFHVGDLLGIDATGRAVPNSSYTSTPFTSMEHLTQSPNDTATLLWCRRN